MTKLYDVAIIGASIAGSTVAHILGKSGYSVALIDKARFPRRKPCGEGLSNFGLNVLKRHGLLDDVLKIPHFYYKGYKITSGRQSINLNAPWGGGVAVQRQFFDNSLYSQAALLPTIDTFLGKEVTSLSEIGLSLSGKQYIDSRLVIIADGNGARKIDGINLLEHHHRPYRTGLSCLAEGKFFAPQSNVTIIIKDGFEVFCTPHAQGKLNISILCDEKLAKRGNQILKDRQFMNYVFSICSFEGNVINTPLGRTSLGGSVRSLESNRIVLLGDAKEQFDPVGGMGMTHALCSAEILAEEIIKIFRQGIDAKTCFDTYERRREDIAKPIRRFTSICYHSMKMISAFPRFMNIAASKPANSLLNFITQGIQL